MLSNGWHKVKQKKKGGEPLILLALKIIMLYNYIESEVIK